MGLPGRSDAQALLEPYVRDASQRHHALMGQHVEDLIRFLAPLP